MKQTKETAHFKGFKRTPILLRSFNVLSSVIFFYSIVTFCTYFVFIRIELLLLLFLNKIIIVLKSEVKYDLENIRLTCIFRDFACDLNF